MRGIREILCHKIGLAGPFVFQVVISRILPHWRETCRPVFVTVSMARCPFQLANGTPKSRRRPHLATKRLNRLCDLLRTSQLQGGKRV